MNFKEKLNERAKSIENIIKSYLPEETGLQSTVLKAMNYSVLAGGKRLRPMFMEETFQLFDGKNEEVVKPFMAAMEMIHTYSLVHDDLPAMDNDDYRRGKLTTHKAFGEAMGILAGDALLNYAYETSTKAFFVQDCPYESVALALKVLSEKSGVYGMVGGQVVDVEYTNKKITVEQLEFINKNKTAALVEASMMIGAILAGASKEEISKVEEIATNIGLAFQIKDDILDVVSTMEELGKPIGSDERNEKITYVTLYGILEAQKKVEESSAKAIEIYDSIGKENAFLRELIIHLVTRSK